MTVLTDNTKAERMLKRLHTLASEYIAENKLREAGLVHKAISDLNGNHQSLARLYDIIQTHTKG